MRIAYFDCPTGISGNMIMAALLDAGLPFSYLKKELNKLKLKGYSLAVTNVRKSGFRASHFHVEIHDWKTERTINDIYRILERSGLNKSVKGLSKRIFERLYRAEQRVHGVKRAHLHEVSAIDAIVDIVGTAIGLDRLKIMEIYCSPLPIGYGPIRHAHGTLPNPAPAAAELLKGVPIYKKDIKSELVTPTGAAIITTVAKSFSEMPKMELKGMGLGAGTFDFREPNIMRLFIGESQVSLDQDVILAIETNIDDLNPELYDYVIKKLMRSGALDAYITPIRMKKKRPAVTLTVLSEVRNKDSLLDAIFSETTTLGTRTYLVKREKLQRSFRKVKTKFGSVMIKIGKVGSQIKNIAPEYEDCVKLSRKNNVPLKIVYNEAKLKALDLL